MTTTITIGRRLVPVEQIVMIEPFEPAEQQRLQSQKQFRTRIVLLDRDSVLTEEELTTFATTHRFRLLAEDGIATNSAVHSFRVEAFERTPGFEPARPYQTRLSWRGADGQVHSKLLITDPETVLAIVVRGQRPTAEGQLESAGQMRPRAIAPQP